MESTFGMGLVHMAEAGAPEGSTCSTCNGSRVVGTGRLRPPCPECVVAPFEAEH